MLLWKQLPPRIDWGCVCVCVRAYWVVCSSGWHHHNIDDHSTGGAGDNDDNNNNNIKR